MVVFFGARDKDFCGLFERSAGIVHQGAIELLELLSEFDRTAERARKIKDLEHAGDKVTHETMTQLHSTFITSMNREDIRELSSRLDDILDAIDESANRIVLYRVAYPPEDARALAKVLRHATALIAETLPLLRNMKNTKSILERCREIAQREREADHLSAVALANLFEQAKDPKDVIRWKDIYDDLETACNHCKHVANIMEEIVLKNQ